MTPLQTALAGSLLLIGGVLAAHPLAAQGGPCGPRADVVADLAERHGEARQAMGLDARGITEVWVSAETGSFTVTITTPEGMTCLLSAGVHWTAPAPLPTGPEV